MAHPVKCHRPIASGRVSEKTAWVLAAALLLALLCNFAVFHPTASILLGLYLVLNWLYSAGLKNIPLHVYVSGAVPDLFRDDARHSLFLNGGPSVNVYDFDGTIYDGDSTVDFYFYCLRKQPRIAVYAFRQAFGVLRRAAGTIATTRMKEAFFSFLPALGAPEELAASFWEARRGRIRRWYLERKRESDVVISASPEFLLRPVCALPGIGPPIATRMDPGTGRIEGRNCKGEEKVLRFAERFPEGDIRS